MYAADDGMARDFGFDISMPDGNVGLPSAAHKLFMERCKVLYREFLANMAVHMKTEKQLKRALRSLHEEKIRNLRFSLYRSESADPFSRKQVELDSSTTAFLESRGNTPWGLDVIQDEDGENALRPQTAPAGAAGTRKGAAYNDVRPKTAGCPNNMYDSDEDSDSGLSDMSAATKSTVTGVVDRKSEQSSGRKITVGQKSFTKITHGNVKAKLKHKDGRFVVKPVKVDLTKESSYSDTTAYDPSVAKQKFDPATERLALVRKITSFKTPTISSDMKINNRVPIQKRLRGLDAKRTTISEIYQSARDRRARHFRIVTDKPAGKVEKEIKFRQDLSTRWARALRQSFSVGVQGGLAQQMLSAAAADGEGNQAIPRSIIVQSANATLKSLGEKQNAKELADDAFLNLYQQISKGSTSKVAFARHDSEISNDNVFVNDENVDLNDSANGPVRSPNPSSAGHFGSKLFLQLSKGRARSVSGNSESDLRSSSSSFSRNERRENTPNDVNTQGTERHLSSAEGSCRGGRTPTDVSTRGGKQLISVSDLPVQGDRPQSVSSIGTASPLLPKKKQSLKQSNGTSNGTSAKKAGSLERTLSSDVSIPSKLESRRDTVKIVKQQMRMDSVLDERMAVWRRRMAVKSHASTTKLRPSPRRGMLV